MKNFTKLVCAVFFVVASLFSNSAHASHFKGGDTYFVCLGNGQYQLVFACYYACEPTSISYDTTAAAFSWTITSTCGTVPTFISGQYSTPPVDVPLYCPGVLTQCDYYNPNNPNGPYAGAPPGAPIGTILIVYKSAPFAIPAGCTVTATMDNGSRNAAITNLVNPGGTDINIEATLTTPADGSCNNNPQFAQYPVNIFCLGQNANFSQGAIDLDGDSLTYTLINPRNAGGVPIPFVAGCTPSNPLGVGSGTGFASSFTFDSTTGNVNFTPTASGDYVLTVQVNAYHNGVLVGSTMRDIQFTVVICNNTNNPPVLTQLFTTADVSGATVIDSNHIGVCPGELVTINLPGTDPDLNNYIIDSTNVRQSLPGSTVSVTHSGTALDTAILHITWTPTVADSGYHYFLVAMRDTFCPTPGRNTYAFIVSVLTGVYAGPNQVYCNGGQPVTIYASGANHYIWTDSATGGPPVGVISYGPDSSYIVVAPGTTSGYVVQGDLLGSCKNRDTVKVVNAPLFSLTANARDTSICKYTSTQLTVTPTPTNVGPFTYSWSPASWVVSPTASTTPTKSLLNSTEFYVTVTAAGGCAIRDSAYVAINGSAPRIQIFPSNNNVCPGDTITLNTQVFAENLVTCGLVDTCTNNNLLFSVAVNNDTSSSTGNGGTFTNTYCSPFMGSFNSYKAQYLFTKAELNAAGLSSGSITDLSFFVKQIFSTAGYDTFTVSMGCTNVDSLTGFVNNLQEVVPPQMGPNAVVPNPGWTPFPFTHYYNWDGSSNLVVQVCYTINSTMTSQDDFVSYSTTPYMGSSIIAGDYNFFGTLANGCSLDNSANFYLILKTRPNIKFGMCAPNVLSYLWTPSTLLCDTCGSTQVIVRADTTYTLRVSAGICVNDTTTRLLINPYIAVVVPDTTICAGDTVRLGVALTNPPPSQCVQGYTVASIPYATINGLGTTITPVSYVDAFGGTYATDNGTAGPYGIGFSFPFYCQNFSQFYVNSNGWLTFQYPYPATTVTQEYTAQTFPPSSADLNPQKVIELMMGNYWLDDGFGDGGGYIAYFTTGTAPNRTLVVQFIRMADVNVIYTTSGEMHLHETSGVIDILLTRSTYTGTAHTTGIKDSTGLGIAAPGRNNQMYTITTNEAWSFTPQFGPSVAVNTSVWSPNTFLSNDSVNNPLAYPPASQTYYVNSNLVINQYTNPTLCAVHDSVRVNIDHFNHTLTASPLTICPGDTSQITFNPLGNTVPTYVWTPAAGLSSATIANPLASIMDTTTYYVTATDNHGCKVQDSITIDIFPVPHPVIGPGSTVCYSDSFLLSLSGTYSNYRWYSVDSVTGARTLVSSGTGDSAYYAHPSAFYVLEVTPVVGQCSYFTNVVKVDTFSRQAIVVLTNGPTGFCIGGNVVLETNQGLNNIQWTPASFGSQTSFPVTTPGTFSYTARDAHNCLLFSDTVTVTVNPLPSFVLNNVKNPICTTDIDTLVAGSSPAGAAITWTYHGTQTAGSTLIATDSGTYYIDANLQGCANDTSILLIRAVSPVVTLPVDTSECNCNPESAVTATVTGGAPGYTYLWSNGGTGASTLDSILGSSSYSVTVTDANHCSAVSNIQSILMSCPKVDVAIYPVSDTIFVKDTAMLTAIAAAGSNYTYLWSSDSAIVLSPGTSVTNVIGATPGVDTVYLLVTDLTSGCIYKTVQTINVIEFGGFAMATAFTPNGDGKNDYFYPAINGPNSPLRVSAFRIYNRWGQLVYDNPNTPGWDGNFGGTPQASETYLYFITVEYPDPSNAAKTVQKSVEGSFQLLR